MSLTIDERKVMKLQLSEQDWVQILKKQEALAGDNSVDSVASSSVNRLASVAFLLFLELPTAEESSSVASNSQPLFQRLLDLVVAGAQPSPSLLHVELVIPPSSPSEEAHFATYLGAKAGWGSSFGDIESNKQFYLHTNAGRWRAVPVCATDAARRLRRVLTNDPATGVMRHADAGYEDAVECAREHQLDLPMIGE